VPVFTQRGDLIACLNKAMAFLSAVNSTLFVRKYYVSDLSSCAGSELGSELTSLAENGVNILKSIDEGPFRMGTLRETLTEGSEGLPKDIYSLINHYTNAKDIWDNVKMLLEGSKLTKDDRESRLYDDFEHFRQNKGETIHDYYVRFAKLINDMRNIKMTMSKMQLNSNFVNNMLPEWGLSLTKNLIENLTNTLALLTQSYKTYLPQTNYQLRTSLNPRNQAIIQDGRVVIQNVQGRQKEDGETMNGVQVQLVIGELRTELGMLIQPKRPQNSEYFKDKMLLMQAQKNGVALDEERLLFIVGGQDNAVDEDVDEQPIYDLALNVDSVFQANACDAFDSDVNEAPTAQTMFMKNLSSADPVYDEAGPSYDSDILSENNVVDKSLTAELPTYKEQVELYERRARFKLTEKEQKIDEQLRIVITDCNIKEENLKKELHSIKMQLASTIIHNKSMVEEVTSLKKDFKQKENKYLEEFLDMKALKEKVEDKLFKQDQSLQTVHMLCKPKPYYDEQRKVAIGYKSPLCLARAKQVQPALYNGYEIIKTDHVPSIVHNSEDTLEIAEITRKKMNEKIKAPLWTYNKSILDPQITPKRIF
nr:hypothetical protein [Tanacetum cinerariifolium]